MKLEGNGTVQDEKNRGKMLSSLILVSSFAEQIVPNYRLWLVMDFEESAFCVNIVLVLNYQLEN